MEQKESFFRNCLGITDDEIIRIGQEMAHIKNVSKNELLYRCGETLSSIPFLLKGCFRFFFTDIEGKEHTDCFSFEKGIAVTPSFDFRNVLPVNIQALEDSEVLLIPSDLIQQLMETNIEIMRLYNKMLIASAKRHMEIKVALYQYDAEKRYMWFLKEYDGLIDRIPHVYIASFLNISPVTLSRIRSKVKN